MHNNTNNAARPLPVDPELLSPEPEPEYDRVLGASDILSAPDLKRVKVRVPEWGGAVYVRMMTGTQRDLWESDFREDKSDNARAKLAVATLCDAAGNLIFRREQISEVGAKGAAGLERVFDAALKLNRLGKQDIDDLAKNS